MDYYNLLYVIPAAAMLGTIVAHASPVEIKAQFNALLIFLCAVVCFYMPERIDLALAVCFPAMWINRFFGARWQGHEPVKYPDVRKVVKYIRLPKKAEVKEFLTKSYPAPDEEPDPDPDPEPEIEEPVVATKVRKYVPEL